MNFKLISANIFKLVGGVSLIHALLSIVLIIISILTIGDIEKADFTQALNDHDIEETIGLTDEKAKEVLSELPKIVKSNAFKELYWGMTIFGFITNSLLLYISYKLIKSKHKFVVAYISLMGVTLAYMHKLPMLITQESNYALSFGAAWGVGNMGVSLYLFTHLWYWGSVLLLVGVVFYYISHNKTLQPDR